jgi:hypothetical protein
MEFMKEGNNWIGRLKNKDKITRMVANKPSEAGTLPHVALTWKENALALFLRVLGKKRYSHRVSFVSANL